MESQWPPTHVTLTTPHVPRTSANLFLHGCTRIHAPASAVFNKILRVKDYPAWNNFTPQIDIVDQATTSPRDQVKTRAQAENDVTSSTLQKDSLFILHARMAPGKTPTQMQMRVSDYSTPTQQSSYIPRSTLDSDGSYFPDLSRVYRIAWKVEGSWMAKGGMLKAERFVEVIVLDGDKECEVRTWELQGGLLARVVRGLYGKVLPERFETWCADLKLVCEREEQEERAI